MAGDAPSTVAAEIFATDWAEHLTVAAHCRDELQAPFAQLARVAAQSIRNGGKILFCGNGGSAGDAQHLATELTVRFSRNRVPIAALALTTDSSALTAIGNDLGFEHLFARQVEALARPGDLLVGISTSGTSPNITAALKTARAMNVTCAALSGRDGGDLVGLADPLLIVPSNTTARIQEMHITLGQMLCSALEQDLGLVPDSGGPPA